MKTIITESNYQEFLGRELEWAAPAAEGNFPQWGVAVIKSIDWTKPHACVECEVIAGDDLKFAFPDDCDGQNALCYSDGDRYVTVSERRGAADVIADIVGHLADNDAVPAFFTGNGGTGYELVQGNAEEIGRMLRSARYVGTCPIPDEFAGQGLELSEYTCAARFTDGDGMTSYWLLWDEED